MNTKLDRGNERDDISGAQFEDRVAARLLPYLRPQLGRFCIAVSLVFLSSGVALFEPKLLGMMVDKALVPGDRNRLWWLGALFVALSAVRLWAYFQQNFQLQTVGQRVMHSIRADLLARLIRMPVQFFDRNPVGKLVTRLTNDTQNLSELFSASFVLLLGDVILIVGVIAALIAMHPRLGLITVSVFPLMAFFMWFFSGRLRAAFRRSREVLARLNALFAERMGGMHLVQQMNREAFERAGYKKLSQEFRDRQFEGVSLYALFHPAITILSGVSMVLVIWFGSKFLGEGEIPLGTLVSFFAYVQILYQPVRNITDRYNVFLAAMSSAERIFTLIDMAQEEGLERSVAARSAAPMRGVITFDRVTFSYNPESGQRALSEVSFELKSGERVALVGHTGAGKTTITSLLLRFYEPTAGAILLDGRDLRSYSKRELRERIGFVQQDTFLFSGTIRENLVLMRQGITDREIDEAAHATGLIHVVRKMPAGLETMLDERGANLSQGERQVLAFTRVFLQRPEILVLDEATANVDRGTEEQIQRASDALVRGRTSLIIAHRLATIENSDRILVFERGSLVEEGGHADLVASGGRYARLVKAQQVLGN